VALMTVISVVSVLAGERLAATDQKARAGDRE
jgi:hypothetical protein